MDRSESPEVGFHGFDSNQRPVFENQQASRATRNRGPLSLEEERSANAGFILSESLEWSSSSSLQQDSGDGVLNGTGKWSTDTQFSVPIIECSLENLDSSGSSKNSVETVALRELQQQPTMDELVGKYKKSVARTFLRIEDDISPFKGAEMSVSSLRKRQDMAVAFKEELQEAHLYLSENDTEFYNTNLVQKVSKARQEIVEFILWVESSLQKFESNQSSQQSHAIVSAKKEAAIKQKSRNLLDEFDRLELDTKRSMDIMPNTDEDLYELASTQKQLEGRISSFMHSAAETSKIALEHNLVSEYNELENVVQVLSNLKINLDKHVLSSRRQTGIWETTSSRRLGTQIPMPKFSGAQDEKITVYEFEEAWKKYKRASGLTNNESVDLLKTAVVSPSVDIQALQSEDEIFCELKQHLGNPLVLLRRKEAEIQQLDLCKGSDSARRDWLVRAKSMLENVRCLCVKHKITDYLYRSSIAADLQAKLPFDMTRDFKKQLRKHLTAAGVLPIDVLVDELICFLEDKIADCTLGVNLELVAGPARNAVTGQLTDQSKVKPPVKEGNRSQVYEKPRSTPVKKVYSGSAMQAPQLSNCVHCKGTHEFLFYCPVYIKAKVSDRFDMAIKQQICVRCLRMDQNYVGKKAQWWDDHKRSCDTTFQCKKDTCSKREEMRQYHVTLCAKHVGDNKKVEAAFIRNLDADKLPKDIDLRDLKFFHLTGKCFANLTSASSDELPYVTPSGIEVLPDVAQNAIFLMQTIPAGKEKDEDLLVFYDSGCSGASLSDRAHKLLFTKTVRPGPTFLDVAGGQQVQVPHGDEQFQLDLADGRRATITGLRMPHITSEFPMVRLREAWVELLKEVPQSYKHNLPQLDDEIGGREVDVMLGIRYLKYFPELVFTLPSGLSIYKARLRSASGRQAVLGGPHSAWSYAAQQSQHMNPKIYLTMEARAFCTLQSWVRVSQPLCALEAGSSSEDEDGSGLEWGLAMEGDPGRGKSGCHQTCHHCHCGHQDFGVFSSIKQEEQKLWRIENLGTESTFRCSRCRNCSDCKKGSAYEEVSLREEAEQSLIEQSVDLVTKCNRVEASLPFTLDPVIHLMPNRHIAERVLRSQIALFERNPEMRDDVLRSHQKLVDGGYVLCEEDIPSSRLHDIESSPGHGYYIPWRIVYNEGSLSTPCRMVFDASSRTPGGESLNGILAKGVNKLVKLQHLLLRFRFGPSAITADISMAYNGTRLRDHHLKFQRYLWKEDLCPTSKTKTMYIATLIYGVKSSGQQCQVSLRKLAEHFLQKDECQAGATVLQRDVYVDDIITSAKSLQECDTIAEDIQNILGRGSMAVKGFTMSGRPPCDKVSGDGVTVGLAGYKWDSQRDLILLDIGLPRLGKAKRGKRPPPISGDFMEALRGCFTRRILTGLVAGVFDPLGLVTPVVANFKLRLHDVCKLHLDWDEPVPESFLPTWGKIMHQIQDLRDLRFRRAIVPSDAIDTTVHLLVAVDASQFIGIVAIYARFQLRSGLFSCQLLLARSKIMSGMTIPRAELKSAVIGAITANVVSQNLDGRAGQVLFVTDSSVCLHWISQDDRPLHLGVRNAVLEIRRLSSVEQWFHVSSENNIADTGTRAVEVADVDIHSVWQNGLPWMHLPIDQMPIRTASQVTMSGEEKRLAAQEMRNKDIHGHVLMSIRTQVAERYAFGLYIVDPCRFRWSKSLRIMAIVLKFIGRCRKSPTSARSGNEVEIFVGSAYGRVPLFKSDMDGARRYFFQIATQEVKKFAKKSHYAHCSEMVEGVLHFSGRLLTTEDVKAFESVMFDLSPLSFFKPIVDRHSPIAYAIMIEVHWSSANHLSAAVTYRESLVHAYILQGQALAKEIRGSCAFCKRFKARLNRVAMGKVHETRLAIAPPFYHCQVDILGPFKAQCEHNHRSTVKVWGVVFKDPASLAVYVHAMSKYDTSAFVMAYTRFAARFGHPLRLFPDEGSQLIKACEEMGISWMEVSRTLAVNHGVGVEFAPCPVGGHNYHGVVERSIREIRKLFETVYRNCKLDVLGFETAFGWISNELNNLPICLGSKFKDLDCLDLLTPNRLIQGKNNKRAMSGCCTIPKPSLMLERMEDIFNAWWKAWTEEKLIDYVAKPSKWTQSDAAVKEGDIVVFLKDGSEQVLGEPAWRIGRIKAVEKSHKDEKVRAVTIEYKVNSETKFRVTRRAVRTIAVLFGEDDIELSQELNAAARDAERSINHQGLYFSRQRAVICEINQCPLCVEPMLCVRHLSYFKKNPFVNDDDHEQVCNDIRAKNNQNQGFECDSDFCQKVNLHCDPWV